MIGLCIIFHTFNYLRTITLHHKALMPYDFWSNPFDSFSNYIVLRFAYQVSIPIANVSYS